MQFKCVSVFKIVLIFFCYFHSSYSWSQVDSDTLSTDQINEILLSEREIQGVSYQFQISSINNTLNLSELGLKKGSRSQSLWVSEQLNLYEEVISLQETIFLKTKEEGKINYFLFNEPVSFSVLKAYLENMIRNELFIPNDGASEVLLDNQGKLIVMGAKLPYKPFYKLKIKILEDIKMILLISILLLFLVASVLLVLVMLVIKTQMQKKEMMTNRFQKLSYEPLCTLLFEHELSEIEAFSKDDLESFFPKNHLHKPLFKNVMIREIIALNKNMKGEFKTKLKLIYRKLELDKITLAKLKNKRWDIVTTGIVEVNEMNLVEAIPILDTYISNTNFYIRSTAVATLLSISGKNELKVLAAQKYPLSRWQQMIYFRIIKSLSVPISESEILSLLKSDNQTVRIFGIKLIRFLGRVDCLESLSTLYANSSDTEKLEILCAYDAFNAVGDLEQVHQALYSEDTELCLQAIHCLKNLGNTHSQALLLERLLVLKAFEVKKQILTTLYTLNKEHFYEMVSEMVDEDSKKIFRHLEDPVLSYV